MKKVVRKDSLLYKKYKRYFDYFVKMEKIDKFVKEQGGVYWEQPNKQ